jgi:YVTN family beta-propeller protein
MRFLQERKRLIQAILIVLVLAVVLPYCYINTRPTQIMVTVRDRETGAFLGDTVVSVQNNNGQEIISFITDEQGQAGVKRLQPSPNYRLLARHIDYVPAVKRNVPLELHKTTDALMLLRPKPGGRLFVGLDRAYVATVDRASNLFISFEKGPEIMRNWPVRFAVAHPTSPWLFASSRYISFMLEPLHMDVVAELTLAGNVLDWQLVDDGKTLLALVRNRAQDQVAMVDTEFGAEKGYIGLLSSEEAPIASEISDETYVLGGAFLVSYAGAASTMYRLEDLIKDLPEDFRFSWAVPSSDRSDLYLGGSNEARLMQVNTASWTVRQDIELGPGIVDGTTLPDGSRIYLVNRDLGLVTVLNRDTLGLEANIPVGKEPIAIVSDPAGERIYIANQGARTISVLDVATGAVIETIDVGLRPFSLATR